MSRILTIDDDHTSLTLISSFIEKLGHTAIHAENGYSGLELARDGAPDLILLDLVMPDHTGFYVLEELKKNTMTRRIPVIIVTANASRENIMKAMNYRVSDYLAKGFDFQSFKQKVEAALHYVQLQRSKISSGPADNMLISRQTGQTVITLKQFTSALEPELKGHLSPSFLETIAEDDIIIDFRYCEDVPQENHGMVSQLIELFGSNEILIVAGKHYASLTVHMELPGSVKVFISYGDMELYSYEGEAI
jgi:DNA-binding response OmpR family regulator